MVKKNFKIYFYAVASMFIVGIVLMFSIIAYYSKDLPNHNSLKDYNPPITTRLYSSDGRLLKEYAIEKRLFVPIQQIPDLVKYAFISAEDAEFYSHIGINMKSILSAMVGNTINKVSGSGGMRGGSTITQQVAKNFLLSSERTFDRKIKEAILSIRMTQAFTKDQILELYLNQIYLGNRSYGVASAALNYFDKSLDELTIEEACLLASLPKAPGKLDPTKKDQTEILGRRNWVIERMAEDGYISRNEAKESKSKPIILKEKTTDEVANGEFFSEEVRKEVANMYGEQNVMTSGYMITTTLDPTLQNLADKFLKEGIENYDVRHGYRGAIDNLSKKANFLKNWPSLINNYREIPNLRNDWGKAIVLGIDNQKQKVLIGLGEVDYSDSYKNKLENSEFIKSSDQDDKLIITGYIPLANLIWARRYINVDSIGSEIKKVSDVGLKIGDIIVVEKNVNVDGEYYLKQIPAVNGALIAIDPNNGNVLAMMGGYIDSQTDFNRATQAERQPGSTMKPFAYLTALENGYNPANIIIDEEVQLDQGKGMPPYIPKNSEGEGKFFGPTTLRVGLEKSRNVTTVRLASEVGISKVAEVVKRFGINDKPQKIYSLVLGSTETNLIRMVRAYAIIDNGGKEITPTLIKKIQDKNGITIYKAGNNICNDCEINEGKDINDLLIPEISDNRKIITDSATAYQITNMLVGVVQRGTAWRAREIGKPIAAKTGTTNDGKDAWFIGFSPNLVVGVYVGFDRPEYMGRNEMGGSVAGPIFTNFMKAALANQPSIPFKVPPTVKLVKIDSKTGYYPSPSSNPKDIVLEAFKFNDEIVKFDDEMSDENIDEYIQGQENSITNRPQIIDNVVGKPEKDEKFIEEMNKKDYEIESEETQDLNESNLIGPNIKNENLNDTQKNKNNYKLDSQKDNTNSETDDNNLQNQTDDNRFRNNPYSDDNNLGN